MKTRPRLLRITTVPISLKLLLRGQFSFFSQQGFEVLAVSADGPEVAELLKEGVAHKVVPMTREITPGKDLMCLFQLIKLFKNFKPDIVHTHTPKAGLLGMMAAWVCRVPVRMHTVAGLPLMESNGLKRRLLIITERITYWCATAVYPNSFGLLDFIKSELIAESGKRKVKSGRLIVESGKWKVIGRGSSNGIDVKYFSRTPELEKKAVQIRISNSIPQNAIVFCFVGRIVKDKGITELTQSFKVIQQEQQNVYLLLVGPLEPELDPLATDDLQYLVNNPNVIFAGYQNDVRPWMMASDVFVFPSYREGFPNVVMQAACLQVPCIVSDINGCNELIENKVSGLIVQPKDAKALYEAMKRLAEDSHMCKTFAEKARVYIAKNFDQQFVWEELKKEYLSKLKIEN